MIAWPFQALECYVGSFVPRKAEGSIIMPHGALADAALLCFLSRQGETIMSLYHVLLSFVVMLDPLSSPLLYLLVLVFSLVCNITI